MFTTRVGIGLIAVLVVLIVAALVVLDVGLPFDAISVKTLGLSYSAFKRAADADPVLAIGGYLAAFTVLGALFLPGSPILVVASGVLFGATLGIPLALFATTLGATSGFLIANVLWRRLYPGAPPVFVERFRAGFEKHPMSYLLFLRLTPGLPFAAMNAVPAVLGVSLPAFMAATFVGLAPSRIALSTAGAGLASIFDAENIKFQQCQAMQTATSDACPYGVALASLLTPQTVAAFAALAVCALIPALIDVVPRLWQRYGWGART